MKVSGAMAEQLTYSDEAADGYDRTFGCHVSVRFAPALVRAAQLGPGMRVLDIATGTGLVAGAALSIVGPTGHVTAADLSPAMLAKARERLGRCGNCSIAVEDGQALSFPDGSFDVVLCNLGLMFFPDPARGLSEFRRVLRPGGRAAVSVGTAAEYDTQVIRALARYAPQLAEAADRMFSLDDAARLRSLFAGAGFQNVATTTELQRVARPSFAAYFEPYERGGGSIGQAYIALPDEARSSVREEVRRGLGDTGGPIEIDCEIRLASGAR
jgi:ubiquinone/menaquinone biosynthesis C-methylase UbiE